MLGGLAVGALASPYNYGYGYPAYGDGYGYPAYSYGPGYAYNYGPGYRSYGATTCSYDPWNCF